MPDDQSSRYTLDVTGQSQSVAVIAEITLLTSVTPLSKIIGRDPQGIIYTKPAPSLDLGAGYRFPLTSMRALADFKSQANSHQGLAFGQLKPALPDRCVIVTRAKLQQMQADNTDPTVTFITRTQSYLEYVTGAPGVVLQDLDLKDLPQAIRDRIGDVADPRVIMGVLNILVPGVTAAGWVIRASTSSNIYRTDAREAVTGIGGWHVDSLVRDASDAQRYLKTLHQRCWLAGLGWHVVGEVGQLLERSLIDAAVYGPERIVYEAPPTLEGPLAQHPREPMYQEGPALDTRLACPDLTADEMRVFKAKIETSKRSPELLQEVAGKKQNCVRRVAAERNITEQAAAKLVNKWHEGRLDLGFVLPFDDPELAGATVADVFKNPDQYLEAHLADPFQPETRNRAMLCRRFDSGIIYIRSFAHGGTDYALMDPAQTVADGHRDRMAESALLPLPEEIERTIAALQTGRILRAFVPDWCDADLRDAYVCALLAMYDSVPIVKKQVAHPILGAAGGLATFVWKGANIILKAGDQTWVMAYPYDAIRHLLDKAPQPKDSDAGQPVAARFAELIAGGDNLSPIEKSNLIESVAKKCFVKVAALRDQIKAIEKQSSTPDKSATDVAEVASDRDYREQVAVAVAKINERYSFVNESGSPWAFRWVHDPLLNRGYYERTRPKDLADFYRNEVIFKRDEKGQPRAHIISDLWMRDPARRQFLNGVIFDPGHKDPDPEKLNLWRDWAVTPKPGSWGLMKSHMLNIICGGMQVEYEYLYNWTARLFQYPGLTGEAAVVMGGPEGSGKGFLARAIRRICGQHGLHVTSAKHAVGNFNVHLRDTVFLFADEAFFAGNKEHADLLKGLITEPTLMIEGKGRDAVMGANLLHIMIASNHDWVVPVSLKDRRIFMPSVVGDKIGDFAYFDAIQSEMENGGYEAMLHELLAADISGFNPRRIPDTKGLQEQKKRSLQTHHAWWRDVLHRGYIGWQAKEWEKIVSTKMLYDDYTALVRDRNERHPLSQEQFGAFLQELGCKSVRLRVKDGPRLYSYSLGALDQARAAFIKATGIEFSWANAVDCDAAGEPIPDGPAMANPPAA